MFTPRWRPLLPTARLADEESVREDDDGDAFPPCPRDRIHQEGPQVIVGSLDPFPGGDAPQQACWEGARGGGGGRHAGAGRGTAGGRGAAVQCHRAGEVFLFGIDRSGCGQCWPLG